MHSMQPIRSCFFVALSFVFFTSASYAHVKNLTISHFLNQYIINEEVFLSNQRIREIIELPDRSQWAIVGTTGSPGLVGSGLKRVRIFESTDEIPDPREGERSDYYMLIDGNSHTFFVVMGNLRPEIIFDEEVILSNQRIREIIELPDGSQWAIIGTTGSPGLVGSGIKRVRIFESTDEIPDPREGERSDYYMLIDGNSHTFFVRCIVLPQNTGILKISIGPDTAINSGARWRRVGRSAWRDGDTTECCVPVGTHTVEFSQAEHFQKPDGFDVLVIEGETTEESVIYQGLHFKVSFNSQEGVNPVPATKDVAFSSVYGSLPTTTRPGYTFQGWFTEEEGGTEITSETIMTTAEDHTLYAQWVANSYEVSFDPQGGSTPYPLQKQVFFDSAYGSLPTTTRPGYTFQGWFTEAVGGTEITSETIMTTAEDHTLYAQWVANSYEVNFDPQGGTTPDPETKKITFGSVYGTLPTITRIGYTFNGWFTATVGGEEVTAETFISIAEDHILYAQWSANFYEVTFDPQGGGIPDPAFNQVEFDSAYGSLPSTDRPGYTFQGWFTEEEGGTEITSETIMTTAENHTLYAQWRGYFVTYHGNNQDGGSPPLDESEYAEGTTVTVKDNTGGLIKNRHSFWGWNTRADGSGNGYRPDDAFLMPGADVDLYAQWALIPEYFLFPNTGQTKCYDNEEEITCPQPGEPFYGQDAQHAGPGRSYTKLGQGGTILPDDALHVDEGGPWMMTRDNVTGLVWEVKSSANNFDRHSWQNAQDVFLAGLNGRTFGGFDNWRLPTIKELASLVDSSIAATAPTISSRWFPLTVSANYWSSLESIGWGSRLWHVSFETAMDGISDRANPLYVRAVRSEGIISYEPLIVNGDGTVTDPNTSLMWQFATPPEAYTWEQALAFAVSLRLAGHTDWRLPNRNEIQSLIDHSRQNPSIAPVLEDNTYSAQYWTSTTVTGSPENAWTVDFGSGNVGVSGKTRNHYVRMVRSGMAGDFGALTVTILPEGVVADGAQWRRKDTMTWRGSDQREVNVPVGEHEIEFKVVNGWTKPAGMSVLVTQGETMTVSATYTPGLGRRTLDERCVSCHTLRPIIDAELDQQGWVEVVNRMMAKGEFGPPLTDQEQQALVDYLIRTPDPTPIPTLSQWGMFLLAGVMLVLGAITIRRIRVDSNRLA